MSAEHCSLTREAAGRMEPDWLALGPHTLDRLERHIAGLHKCASLQGFLALELAKAELVQVLDGLFCPFPQPPPDPGKVAEWAAARLVEVLVYCGLGLDRLGGLGAGQGPAQVYTLLQDQVMASLPSQPPDAKEWLEAGLAAVAEWVVVARPRPASPSHYDSEGSMPEEGAGRPGRNGPGWQPLQQFLVAELGSLHSRKFTRACLENITQSMCETWQRCGLNYAKLNRIFLDKSLTPENLERILISYLRREILERPVEWRGFTWFNCIDATKKFFGEKTSVSDKEFLKLEKNFQEAISKVEGRARNDVARCITKAVEDTGYTYLKLKEMVESNKDEVNTNIKTRLINEIKDKYPSSPEDFGGFTVSFIVRQIISHFHPLSDKENTSLKEKVSILKRKSYETKPEKSNKRHKAMEPDFDEWTRWYSGNENDLDTLCEHCETVKVDYDMWQYTDSRKIVLAFLRLLEKNKYSTASIRSLLTGKDNFLFDIECAKIFLKIFGEEKRRHKETKGYTGSSDFDIYKNLLDFYCNSVRNTKDEANSLSQQKDLDDDHYVESLDTINTIIKELQKRYQKEKRCLNSFNPLHEHIYFSPSLRCVKKKSEISDLSNDLVAHLQTCDSLDNLQSKIEEVKTSMEKQDWPKEFRLLLNVNKFPSNCLGIQVLILNVILEFFDHANHKIEISNKVKEVQFTPDKSNSLAELQTFIFQSYIQTSVKMLGSGKLEGFSVDKLDLDFLSSHVHSTVNFLIDAGFNLYEAIEHYIEGSLIDVLKNLFRKYEKCSDHSYDCILLTRICFDFIDAKVKHHRTASLPQSKSHQLILENKILSLMINGKLVKEEYRHNIKKDKELPKSEEEILSKLDSNFLTKLKESSIDHQAKDTNLPKNFKIASDCLEKSSDKLESFTPSPGYCLQFLRQYIQTNKLNYIHQEGDQIYFGDGNSKHVISFKSDQRTSFGICGSEYSLGVKDYYSVECLVYFLLQAVTKETYQDYIKLALTDNKPVVREQDCPVLHHFLWGKTDSCWAADNEFLTECNTEFSHNIETNLVKNEKETIEADGQTQENTKRDRDWSLVHRLKEFLMEEYSLTAQEAAEECDLLLAVLSDCGYSLDRLRLLLLSVGRHKQLLQQICAGQLRARLKERGWGGGREAVTMMQAAQASLVRIARPASYEQLRGLAELSRLLSPAQCEDRDKLQRAEEPLDWAGELQASFSAVVARMARAELPPITSQDPLDLYTAATTNSLVHVVVQQQSGTRLVVGFNMRSLTKEERGASQLEREGWAVVWGVTASSDLLQHTEFRLQLCKEDLATMFSQQNNNTRDWSARLADYKYTVQWTWSQWGTTPPPVWPSSPLTSPTVIARLTLFSICLIKCSLS